VVPNERIHVEVMLSHLCYVVVAAAVRGVRIVGRGSCSPRLFYVSNHLFNHDGVIHLFDWNLLFVSDFITEFSQVGVLDSSLDRGIVLRSFLTHEVELSAIKVAFE
jgi:hypothetical protein